MSGLLGKIPKFTLKLPASLAKYGRTMSECPLELSFSLCEENCRKQAKNDELRSSLQVDLPVEDIKHSVLKNESQETEKADEENSEKIDNMEVTCSVSVDGQEKQEFSFTLYDFDTKDKVNKQDMEKIVVRSICEALGKTLKLPPSGSRTIKVKLAISPDNSKDLDVNEPESSVKWPTESPEMPELCKNQDNQDYDSSKSANTASTYLLSSATEKTHQNLSRSNVPLNSPLVNNAAFRDIKSAPSPKMKSLRHNRLVSLQRQEQKSSGKDHHKRILNENAPDNRTVHADLPNILDNLPHQLPNSRDHVPESRDRKNHYLDLAGIENEPKPDSAPPKQFASNVLDPSYMCPYKILDKTHLCTRTYRNKEFPISPTRKIPCHLKTNNGGNTDATCKMRMDPSTQDDLLNLNFDLCDIMPNAKFDWEKVQHRRSKSYDLHETNFQYGLGFSSPKLKNKFSQNVCADNNQKNLGHQNSTPVHHYRRGGGHYNRDREKQRAMQQVASWITREHASSKEDNQTHFTCGGFAKSPQTGALEKCEHRHLHEHVHHHYHHFANF